MKKFMTLKSYLAEKGQSQEDFDALGVAEKEAIFDTITKNNAEFVQGLEKDSKEQKEALANIEKAQKEQKEMLLTYIDKAVNANKAQSVKSKESLKSQISENIDVVKGLAKGEKGSFTVKANVLRSSIANNTESVRLDDIGQLGVKRRAIYDYFTKIPVGDGNHNGTISYIDWDEASISRAAEVVAEGGTYDESTAAFAEYTKKLVKVGDTLPVSEEFGSDEQKAAAELELFLRVNVNQKIDEKLAVGAGGASDIEGLFTAAPAYSATASGISDPNIKDLCRKMRTEIVKSRGSKYSPNFVAANSETIDLYMLKKDANNNYMFDENGRIAGLDIVEDNNLADGTLVVGDGRFGRVYENNTVEISEGQPDSQFLQDLKTIKAKARLLFLIREVDKTGFLKSTNITSDLTTIGS